ncbi:transporter [Candidatus Falkowbacteria bacterium CG10_big_fil_rev_8_21_14_0_10_39_9]|uniref:Transporter n=1 Tax=Candidatus Falkowbacteria bacterium CG10_big_fil_rev_8_21_14_0_10_39_9 TaxID=1974566 RepID=A0A2M6WPY6_9BACT|nr:MAG: transporter [Candidatus Falkowbacteria bacterium CG10_big_fil_rev_8_21_14_0_10_39_9]
MAEIKSNNPLQGLTLKTILTDLVEWYSWPVLAQKIKINCFAKDPSLNSSLTFLRRTPWARDKIEKLYLLTVKNRDKKINRD